MEALRSTKITDFDCEILIGNDSSVKDIEKAIRVRFNTKNEDSSIGNEDSPLMILPLKMKISPPPP